MKVVLEDPMEKGNRKHLNFGHTVGHALEAYFMKAKNPLSHGHAVALGMIAESFLSMKKGALSEKEFRQVLAYISLSYPFVSLTERDCKEVLSFARLDKKNTSNKITLVLLKEIGKVDGVYQVDDSDFIECLTYITK